MDQNAINILWVLFASFLVFIMQAGFAMVESGMTRSKNSINVAIKNLTDLGVSFIAFWLFGFAIMFGLSYSGILGTNGFFLNLSLTENPVWTGVFFLFQSMFCSTAATIVSGAVAERMKYSSYIISTIILSAIIYPVFGHWSWGSFWLGGAGGWLERLGFVDFAGSTVVHSVGGWIALAAVIILGPRRHRFDDDGKSRKIPGSNVPMVVLGVILLWFGWFGFNGGSTLALSDHVPQILINTALSASAGMLGALIVGWPIYKKPDIMLILNGALAGLVAITANAHVVGELDSIIIGAIGGVVMLFSSMLLEKLRIDDAVGAIPVHLFAGIWGTAAVAIFGDPQLIGTGLSRSAQLSVQLMGIGAAGAWSFLISFILLRLINAVAPLRVDPDDEDRGLNVSEHGENTETHAFFQVLEKQARSADMSLRAPVEPFTEVGQIARRYNLVLDSLEQTTIARDEFVQILSNINDGILLIGGDGRIGPFYSLASEKILEQRDLEGMKLSELLSGHLPETTLGEVDDFIELMFSRDTDPKSLTNLNPLEHAECYFDHGEGKITSKFLRFSFIRIDDGDEIRLMIVVSDNTEEQRLAEHIEREQQRNESEMELFYRMLHVDPLLLGDFLTGVKHDLQTMNAILREESDNGSRLLRLFNLTHGIKGEAGVIGLEPVAALAHGLEDLIEELRRKPTVKNGDFLALAVKLSRMSQLIDRSIGLIAKLRGFKAAFDGKNREFTRSLQSSLEKLTRNLSASTRKPVKIDLSGFDDESIPESMRKPVKDILIQFIRNAYAHGIEDGDVRRSRGKEESGLISISAESSGNQFRLEFQDDGRGIQAAAIREQLIRRGLMNEEAVMKLGARELGHYLFHPQMSTSAGADTLSGRGIGLSLIQELTRKYQGKIEVKSRANEYTRFSLSFPLATG
jgi:Amt family ammonium transporter